MSLTPDTFVSPRGKLRASMLGVKTNDELGEILQQLLADGRAKVVGAADEDEALRHYVYWQAYERILLLRGTEPTQQAVPNEWSEAYGGRQLVTIQSLATEEKHAFLALVPVAAPRSVAAGGTAVRTVIEW